MRAYGYLLSLTSWRNQQFLFLGPKMSSVGSGSIIIFMILNLFVSISNTDSRYLFIQLNFHQKGSAYYLSFQQKNDSIILYIILLLMKKVYSATENIKSGYLNGNFKSKSPKNQTKDNPIIKTLEKPSSKMLNNMGSIFSQSNQRKGIQKRSLTKFLNNNPERKYNLSKNFQPEELLYRFDVNNREEYLKLKPVTKDQKQQDFFSLSMKKIDDIRSKNLQVSINTELNEVLNMIKEEKLKICEKMKIQKKNNQYYRQVCQGGLPSSMNRGTNTQEILDMAIQKLCKDKQTQVLTEELELAKDSVDEKEVQSYRKLCIMLKQMNIDYTQILPDFQFNESPQLQQRQYKSLTDVEVIKIQKFFIKKLIAKLSK